MLTKFFILVINRKETHLVEQKEADKAKLQYLQHEDLVFTKRKSPKEIEKLSLMCIKNSYITHLEIVPGVEKDLPEIFNN